MLMMCEAAMLVVLCRRLTGFMDRGGRGGGTMSTWGCRRRGEPKVAV